MSKKTSNLKRRIHRVKLEPFVDSLERAFPQLDYPRPPAMIRCLLPDHDERTGSFWLREARWWCFGCGRGGDILDFAQHYHDVDLRGALKFMEHALGFEQGDEGDIQALILQARKRKGSGNESEWVLAVRLAQETYTKAVRPFLTCVDPIVCDIAWSRADYVYDELFFASHDPPPASRRALRQRIRKLNAWVEGWADGTARDIERVTGKDVVDAQSQRR